MRTFKTLQEKQEYGSKVMPRVLLFGGGWMVAWGVFTVYFQVEWAMFPMVFGFIFLLFNYYLI